MKKLHPQWLSGFIDGEGTFHISIIKNHVNLQFAITQHIRDKILMEKIVDFLNCGYLINDTPNKLQFRIRKKNDIRNNLIPLIENNSLQTIKRLDYIDFKKALEIIEKKEHLTKEGLEEIRKLKNNMNRNRKID